MSNTLIHKDRFPGAQPDTGNANEVGPNAWLKEHVFQGSSNGALLMGDSTQSDGVSWTSDRVTVTGYTLKVGSAAGVNGGIDARVDNVANGASTFSQVSVRASNLIGGYLTAFAPNYTDSFGGGRVALTAGAPLDLSSGTTYGEVNLYVGGYDAAHRYLSLTAGSVFSDVELWIGQPVQTAFAARVKINGVGAAAVDVQNEASANVVAYFSPSRSLGPYDRWTIGAGQIASNDFGIGNADRSTFPLVIAGGATGGQTLLQSAAGVQLQLAGRTASYPALKRNGAFVQLRVADDSGISGAATGSLPAAGAAQDGLVGFDTTVNTLVFYVGGARYKVTGIGSF